MIYAQKYRPKTIEECILPKGLKETFTGFLSDGKVPNLLLSGPAGTGKTTVARALVAQLGGELMMINASLDGNIDTLRHDIKQFATSMSITTEGRKFVILDEADYLNANSTQPALRNFMEEYAGNCGFILTCNYPNRIIDPLKSRLALIEFSIPQKEKPVVMTAFYKRLLQILEAESVEFDKAVVQQLVVKHFPDYRKVLNELQRAGKVVDVGLLSAFDDRQYQALVGFMKDNDYTAVRRWVGENSDIETHVLYRKVYDSLSALVQPQSIPQVVVTLGEYQYKAAFVADPEINIAACLAEIMVGAEWK